MEKSTPPNPLEHNPFSFRKYKNGKISVYYKNKEIQILKGQKAVKFSLLIENATEFETQLIMAKITGNFKHGNEREAKLKRK